MTKPWISDTRQRRSKKYRDIHAKLAVEILEDKRTRKVREAARYKQSGGN